MRKLSVLFSILLLGLIPVVNTKASVNSYTDPQWTTRTGPFPSYGEMAYIDITGWESMVMYLDPNIDTYFDLSVSYGGSTIHSQVQFDVGSSIKLEDLYDSSVGGDVWFEIPSGATEMRVLLYKEVGLDDSVINTLNSTFTEIFTRSIADQTGGYQTGYQDGYNEAIDNVQQDLDQAYSDGYTQGQLDSDSDITAIGTFIPQILSLGFGFFFQIFSIEVMGISVLQWFATIMTLSMGIIIFRVFLK